MDRNSEEHKTWLGFTKLMILFGGGLSLAMLVIVLLETKDVVTALHQFLAAATLMLPITCLASASTYLRAWRDYRSVFNPHRHESPRNVPVHIKWLWKTVEQIEDRQKREAATNLIIPSASLAPLVLLCICLEWALLIIASATSK
ncbi:MAG: hypothetical protein HYZ49_21370 [Chloroflexi bacterium]|nr:hypothetical protein [Chloroflexota bacterium]